VKFFRQQTRDYFEVVLGSFLADLDHRGDAVGLEVIVKRLDEGLAEFIARAFGAPSRIAGLARLERPARASWVLLRCCRISHITLLS
jgi:hypothetical protein